MQEVWRKIPGLPDRFEASDLGRIRSVEYINARGSHVNSIIYTCKNARVGLYIEGKQIDFAVAALVLRGFVGPPPLQYGRGKCISRHLDDDRTNNKLENLAWGTPKDNSNDAIKNGKWLTEEHVTARNIGFRIKFPKRKMQPCKCGCGELVRQPAICVHGHNGRKLTVENIEQIQSRYKRGNASALASEFDVCYQTILDVASRRNSYKENGWRGESESC
jgi:hypothetical protein